MIRIAPVLAIIAVALGCGRRLGGAGHAPCLRAHARLSDGAAWLRQGEVAAALGAADDADRFCNGEPGRGLRERALVELGLSAPLREAYHAYKTSRIEREELEARGELGAPLRAAERALRAAEVVLDDGLVGDGLGPARPPTADEAQALLEALLLAEADDLAEARARLERIPIPGRSLAIELHLAELAADAGDARAAGRHAARALFAVEWEARREVAPGLLRATTWIPVARASVSADHRRTVIIGNGVTVWRLDTDEPLLQLGERAATAAALSAHGRLVASGDVGTIEIHDVLTGQRLRRLTTDSPVAPGHLTFGDDGELIAVLAENWDPLGTLIGWRLADGAELRRWDDAGAIRAPISDGAGGVITEHVVLEARGDDGVRWILDPPDVVSLDVDGRLWGATVESSGRITVVEIDRRTGKTRGAARLPAVVESVQWVGSDALIGFTKDQATVRVDFSTGEPITLSADRVYFDDRGQVGLTSAGSIGYLEPRHGHRRAIGVAPEVAPVGFAAPGRAAIGFSRPILVEDGRVTSCRAGIRLMFGVVPSQNLLLAEVDGRLAAIATTDCTPLDRAELTGERVLVSRYQDDGYQTTQISIAELRDDDSIVATGSPELLRLIAQGVDHEAVGEAITDVAAMAVDSAGTAVWWIGRDALERHPVAAGEPVERILRLLVITEDYWEDAGLIAVAAGGGRLALQWRDGRITVLGGGMQPVELTGALGVVAMSPDGATLAVSRPGGEVDLIDVASRAVLARYWQRGNGWMRIDGSEVVGTAIAAGEASALRWTAGPISLPGFVAWRRQAGRVTP